MALAAQRKEVLQAAWGRTFKLLAVGSAAGLLLGILASRVLAFVVYRATPRDPLVLSWLSHCWDDLATWGIWNTNRLLYQLSYLGILLPLSTAQWIFRIL
jgi:hypothetical protein